MIKHSNNVPVQKCSAATTPRSIVVRSLRRRLWQAFQREDGHAAMRIYQATRIDWEGWVRQEEEQARKKEEEEQRKQRPSLLNRIKKKKLDRGSSKEMAANNVDLQSIPTSPSSSADSSDVSIQLLLCYSDPSDPFGLDDYKSPTASYDEPEAGPSTTSSTVVSKQGIRHKLRQKQARLAIAFWGRSAQRVEEFMDELDPSTDARMTSPLHEAARLGDADLVRLFLQHDRADPNIRNGGGRTALHMVAGGVTHEESCRLAVQRANTDAHAVGLRKPLPMVSDTGPSDAGALQNKMGVRALGRILMGDNSRSGNQQRGFADPAVTIETPKHIAVREDRWEALIRSRRDAALAIMSWYHPNDGTPEAGEGASMNAVDRVGRTALHCAAELGRSDICMQLLSSFGTMLTIVDDGAQTPCELASAGKHDNLAAQLEARALLYMDPYGVDDELLAAVMADENGFLRNVLAPPFSWFDTWSMDAVQKERNRRVDQTLRKMKAIADIREEEENARKLMFLRVIDGKDPKLRPRDEVALKKEKKSKAGPKTNGEDSGDDDGDGNEPDTCPRIEHNEASEPVTGAETTEEEENDAAESVAGPKTTGEDEDKVAKEEAVKGKDKEVIAMGRLNKSHVELFLTFHHWDVRAVLLKFFLDPVEAFKEAGIPVPTETDGLAPPTVLQKTCCLICCDIFEADSSDWRSLEGCKHSFCAECLGEYISDCAQSKTTGLVVVCPHHECKTPLSPLEVVNLSPNTYIYGKLIDTANENFVVSAEDLHFCPHPACYGVSKFNLPSYVNKAGFDNDLITIIGAVCTAVHENTSDCLPTYEGVRDPNYFNAKSLEQPKRAHRFCFECGSSEIHWPVSCKTLEEWKTVVEEEIKNVESEGEADTNFNDVAQRLWLKANTRPCPKCKAPIEKDEGCNHMTCSNPRCKYEFCWICRNDWKLHNTETGGFFRCNRWEDQKDHQAYDDETPPTPTVPATIRTSRPEDLTDPGRMEITYGTAMHETRIAGRRARQMQRFLHHYQRYFAHAESAELEKKMGGTVCTRLAPVVDAAIQFDASPGFNFGGIGLSFVHAAFTELLECRSVLQHSYVFSYFRYKSINPKIYRLAKRLLKEKVAFEQTQAELEMMAEQMSNVVARAHLRATRAQITFLTATSADKRKEFSNLMLNLLNEERKEERSEAGDESEKEKAFQGLHRAILNGSRVTGFANVGRSANGTSSSRETSRASSEDNKAIEQALKASLEEFIANTGSRDVLNIDGDTNEDQGMDWPCSACTYMNNAGNHCAICGTPRS